MKKSRKDSLRGKIVEFLIDPQIFASGVSYTSKEISESIEKQFIKNGIPYENSDKLSHSVRAALESFDIKRRGLSHYKKPYEDSQYKSKHINVYTFED